MSKKHVTTKTSHISPRNGLKILLVSSSGGHFEQLSRLKVLREECIICIVTEKTKYNRNEIDINYYLPQVNRKSLLFPFKMFWIGLKSFTILVKERPNAVISTGVLVTIPMLYLAHFLGKKVIYIESFAKIDSPTMTGKLVYRKRLADRFYVQWKSMLKYYPDAIYKGGIY